MSKPFIAVLMGADSDLPAVQAGIDVLKKLDIPVEVRIYSAHHTPDAIRTYVKETDKRGIAAFIVCFDMTSHLADMVASHTIKPVIGLMVDSDALASYMPALKTPSGVPVATLSAGKSGAKNAGYLAAQIIALGDKELANRMKMERQAKGEEVLAKDAALQKQLTD